MRSASTRCAGSGARRRGLSKLFLAVAAAAATAVAARAEPPGMALVPGGTFRPFDSAPGELAVRAFYLDRYPVTNQDYAEFLRAVPGWRPGEVSPLRADSAYLSGWPSPEPGGAGGRRPVTAVSWFAARAYCAWRGKRLPTTAEWERAALASAGEPDGRDDPRHVAALIDLYERPLPPALPVVGGTRNYWGVYDLHGLVWEWVEDFNAAGAAGPRAGEFCGGGAAALPDRLKRDYPAFLRQAFRGSLRGNYSVASLGFRCAADVKEER